MSAASEDRPKRKSTRAKKSNEHYLIDYIEGYEKRSVVMSKEAYTVMALHAALSNYEIIGWLGGYITENVTYVNVSIPVQESRETHAPTKNVEMDIMDSHGASQKIES
jgi:hypothetical protein